MISEDKKDVGQVAKGEPIKHVFVLRNTGNADLHITDVKPSCGCTVPEFDKVIKPGAEGKITLTVDTKNFSGPISKTALVITDDPTVPQKTLFLTAVVKPFVDALPYGFFRITALSGESTTSELILVSDEPDFKPDEGRGAELVPPRLARARPGEGARQGPAIRTSGRSPSRPSRTPPRACSAGT